jgi:hypothetical protein
MHRPKLDYFTAWWWAEILLIKYKKHYLRRLGRYRRRNEQIRTGALVHGSMPQTQAARKTGFMAIAA